MLSHLGAWVSILTALLLVGPVSGDGGAVIPARGGIAAGDLDGDGDVDLVASVASSRNVTVMGNLGDRRGRGRFSSQASYEIGPGTPSIADVDGDEDLDLLLLDLVAQRLYVLLNDGLGAYAFADPPFYDLSVEPVSCMVVGDLDGDGDPDVLLGHPVSESISILTNEGEARYVAAAPLPLEMRPALMVAGDLDGDRDLDVVVVDEVEPDATLLLNEGDGFFGEIRPVWQEAVVHALALGDADHDGDVDVVVGHAVSGGHTVTVLENDGESLFTPAWRMVAGEPAVAIEVTDLDGDGLHDIAVSSGLGKPSRPGEVMVFHNEPDPEKSRFRTRRVIDVPAWASQVLSADLDADGHRDLAFVVDEPADRRGVEPYHSPGHVTMLFNRGTGSFAWESSVEIGDRPSSVELLDVDGDGRRDLVVANVDDDSISVLVNNGNRSFDLGRTYDVGDRPGQVLVNGDMLIVVNVNGDSFSVMPNNGDGSLYHDRTYATGDRPGTLSLIKLDDDEFPDLVVTSLARSSVSVHYGRPHFTFTRHDAVAVGTLPADLRVADLDGDRDADLVIPSLADDSVSLLLNSFGVFEAERRLITGPAPGAMTMADLRGNGEPDLAFACRGGDSVTVMEIFHDGIYRRLDTYVADEGAWAIDAADLDGDGDRDLVVSNRIAHTVSPLLNRGDGRFDNAVLYDVDRGPSCQAIADLDRDGDLDVVVGCEIDETVCVLRNDGRGRFDAVLSWPAEVGPRVIRAADLDDDGLPDLIVANQQAMDGAVTVLFGSGDGAFLLPIVFESEVQRRK